VKDMKGLKKYPYSGHAVLMGAADYSWQEQEEILALFGKTKEVERQRYARYVSEGIKAGKRPELVGGGLKRSHGGERPILAHWNWRWSMRRAARAV
jgi:putative transposase